MIAAGAAMGIVNFFENAWFNWKLINYPPWRQLWDILPLLLVAVVAGGGVYYGLRFIASPWLKLLAGGGVFMVLYIAAVAVLGKFPVELLRFLEKRH